MYDENVNSPPADSESEESGGGRAAGAGLAACCGPAMAEMTKGCPCEGAFKSHRVAVFAILAAVTLAFLISQVGGILGVIAFARTL
ncbi:MAG: hypothetical protein ACYSXF_04975 [Planctomycetota bacterium]|jgi:hypothetical protein